MYSWVNFRSVFGPQLRLFIINRKYINRSSAHIHIHLVLHFHLFSQDSQVTPPGFLFRPTPSLESLEFYPFHKSSTMAALPQKKMKAVRWEGKALSVSVEEIDVPKIKDPLDAIVRLTSSAICGSDRNAPLSLLPSLPNLSTGISF